jgi:hypothetical protein
MQRNIKAKKRIRSSEKRFVVLRDLYEREKVAWVPDIVLQASGIDSSI